MILSILASARRRSSGPPGPVVTNGTFDADIAGWTQSNAGAGQWIAPGRIRISDLGSYAGVWQTLAMSPGVARTLSFDCTGFAGLFFQVGIGYSYGDTTYLGQNVFAAGTFGPIGFTPAVANSVLWARSLGGGAAETADFDNLVIA